MAQTGLMTCLAIQRILLDLKARPFLSTLTVGAALVGLVPSAHAQVVFVDGTLASPCSDYEPATRECGTGTASATPTLLGALAEPSTQLWVRGGEYDEALVIERSGTRETPLSISSFEAETPVLSGVPRLAVEVRGQSYVTIEGLHVRGVPGFGRLEDSDHIVLRNNHFEDASIGGTSGGLKLVRTRDSVLDSNAFINAQDNVTLQESDRNTFVGNRFETAGHSLLSLRCSSENVVRGNTFANEEQKAMEIYDCEGTSDAPIEYDSTHRNLVEENRFERTLGSDRAHRYNAIQYSGQRGIIRRNLFFDNAGGGIGIQVYSDEALHNYENRIYHNTFVDNRCFALFGAADERATYYDNLVRLNLFFGNTDCAGVGEQITIGNLGAVSVTDNLFATTNPGFVDLVARNFELTEASEAVDTGAYLARMSTSGSGSRLAVDDVHYFFAGNGIEGELGDVVQLEGDTERARVIAVDFDEHVLTLDRSLTWEDGQGLSLAYDGDAPDVGAQEHGIAVVLPDAGVPDGGVDASVGDGGSLDGGSMDAGVGADASVADGGVDGDAGPDDSSGGCSCSMAPAPNDGFAPFFGLALAWAFRWRSASRRRTARP